MAPTPGALPWRVRPRPDTGSVKTTKLKRVCNWAVPADDDNPLCVSCRITRVIPNLADPANRAAWYRLEVAKRRLLFTLIELGLPIPNRIDDPERGLTFEFLADADPGRPPVLTGHADGVITVNIAEADDAERERRRTAMREPYRTLLGHMRHESGHYYWDRLIAATSEIDEFRSLFGDERADYAAALSAYYDARRAGRLAGAVRQRVRELAPVGGLGRNVGALSAHGRHARNRRRMRSVAEAAAPRRADGCRTMPQPVSPQPAAFERLIDSWFPLTYVLNNLNRGLGLADAYPFVLSPSAVAKLKFVDDVVGRAKVGGQR